jgi:type 1 glutamine amidotransferase
MLEAEGFDVTITDTLDALNNYDDITKYDLFVPVWTMGTITGQQCANICKAVAEGAGIAGCHGGMCDSFRNSTDWQFMTGSQWVAHPGNDGTPYMVNLIPGNEFTEGLQDFKVESEQYYIHVDPCVKVYATTTFPVADGPHVSNGEVKVPVVYTKMWGKGRVFYTSLGHTYKVFDIPEARTIMTRGLLWAAR